MAMVSPTFIEEMIQCHLTQTDNGKAQILSLDTNFAQAIIFVSNEKSVFDSSV